MPGLGDDLSATRVAKLELEPDRPAESIGKSSSQGGLSLATGNRKEVVPTREDAATKEVTTPRMRSNPSTPQVKHGEFEGSEAAYEKYLRWRRLELVVENAKELAKETAKLIKVIVGAGITLLAGYLIRNPEKFKPVLDAIEKIVS